MSERKTLDDYADAVRKANLESFARLKVEMPDRYAWFMAEGGSEEALTDDVVRRFRELAKEWGLGS